MFTSSKLHRLALVAGALLVSACATGSPDPAPADTDTATPMMPGGMGRGMGQGQHQGMGPGQGQGQHQGMGQGGMGQGQHQGMGGNQGMGQGQHQGMGQGQNQGMGQGMGQGEGMGMNMGADLEIDATDLPEPEQVARGMEVYETICSACHTIDPPVNLAPPFTHVARHVLMENPNRADFSAHVVDYVTQPSADASVLPAHAIEQFGIMPPQPIGEGRLEDVAAYLWTLALEAHAQMAEGSGGMGGGMMGGMSNGAGGNGG